MPLPYVGADRRPVYPHGKRSSSPLPADARAATHDDLVVKAAQVIAERQRLQFGRMTNPPDIGILRKMSDHDLEYIIANHPAFSEPPRVPDWF